MKKHLTRATQWLLNTTRRLIVQCIKLAFNLTLGWPFQAFNHAMKQLNYHYKTHSIYILIIMNMIIWQTAFFMGCDFKKELEVKPAEAKEITQKEIAIKKLDEPLTMEEWVLNEWGKLGQREQAYAIIQCESRWDEYAVNVNNNGSKDFGLYQLNTVHNIPAECAFDYKCATQKAIELWEKHSWKDWVCAKNLGIK